MTDDTATGRIVRALERMLDETIRVRQLLEEQARSNAPTLYCPPDDHCPGGVALRLHAEAYWKNDGKDADRLFHPLPEVYWYRYTGDGAFKGATVRNHNVWRSAAISADHAAHAIADGEYSPFLDGEDEAETPEPDPPPPPASVQSPAPRRVDRLAAERRNGVLRVDAPRGISELYLACRFFLGYRAEDVASALELADPSMIVELVSREMGGDYIEALRQVLAFAGSEDGTVTDWHDAAQERADAPEAPDAAPVGAK